ncbi:hypothetical protein [Trujillonella humicola]|uniref:hypothetical protein n=1 Tax=Trujillonella humicola TaxID=3383699 RepID=UPI003906ACB1
MTRRLLTGIAVAAVAVSGLVLGPLPVAAAAPPITVTSTGEGTATAGCDSGGACTLRGAVLLANQRPGADTISLPAGTYVLGSGADDAAAQDDAAVGDLDVVGELTVSGAGAGTVVRGSGADRLFDVTPGSDGRGAGASGALVLRDLVLEGGSAPVAGGTAVGGAIRVTGTADGSATSALTLERVTVRDSSARDAGGGVYATDAVVRLTDSTLQGNRATAGDGGGLDQGGSGALTVTGGTVTGNSATAAGGLGGTGGGIRATSVPVALTGTEISANTAVRGAGVLAATDDLTATRLTVRGNTASTGGGLFLAGGGSPGARISHSAFTANDAARGAAFYADQGTVRASYNRIAGNVTSAVDAGTEPGWTTAGTDVVLTRNWWGCASDPAAGDAVARGCDPVRGAPAGTRLVPTLTAAPTTIREAQSSTLTASFLADSAGATVPAAELTALVGLPLTFGDPVAGSLSSAATTLAASGTATAVFTGAARGGAGGARVTVERASTTAAVTVQAPPLLTVPEPITVVGAPAGLGSATVPFAVTATGHPAPTTACTVGGAAAVSPRVFQAGQTTVVCTATNGVTPSAGESFVVTVQTAPVAVPPAPIVLRAADGEQSAALPAFVPTAIGWPVPSVACSAGGAPVAAGRTFPAGITTVECVATNGVGADSRETTTVTVETAPGLVVGDVTADETTPGAGAVATWTATPTGFPAATVTCVDAGGRTVTSGSSVFPAGTTAVTCTAANGTEPAAVDGFTVTVRSVPTITLAATVPVTAAAGATSAPVPLPVTATGSPTPVITCSVDGRTVALTADLPVGVTDVDCTAENAAGSASASTEVVVSAPPTLTVGDVVVRSPDGSDRAATWTSAVTGYPAATVTCDAGGRAVTSGDAFPVGATTLACTATNGVGADATDTATVTVESPPRLGAAPRTATAASGATTATLADPLADVAATGWPAPAVECRDGARVLTAGDAFPAGVTTVGCTATSALGTDTADFPVTVSAAPVLAAVADIAVPESVDPQGGAVVSLAPPAVTAYPAATATCAPAGGSRFPVGTTTVTCSATNTLGTGTTTFTVTVAPRPVLTLPTDAVDAPAGSPARIDLGSLAPGSRYVVEWGDGRTTRDTVAAEPRPGHSYRGLGIYTVTVVGYDALGVSSAPQTVTVTVSGVQVVQRLRSTVAGRSCAAGPWWQPPARDLLVAGTARDDVITLTAVAGGVRVDVGGTRTEHPLPASVLVVGLGGTDTVTVDPALGMPVDVQQDGAALSPLGPLC